MSRSNERRSKERRSKERRLLSVRNAAALLVVALVVGLLLAAPPLRAGAQDISSPALRAVVRGVIWPLAAINNALHIDGMRQWALGSSRGDSADANGATDTTDTTDDTATTTTSEPPDSATPTTTPQGTTSPPTTAQTRPTVDAQHPLRVLVAGDSLVIQIAQSMVRMSDKLPMKVEYRYKVSSGLANPGFFDWPAELKDLVAHFQPDVVVLMFGNNDHVDMKVGGKQLAPSTPEWLAEYQRRAETIAGIAAGAGRKLIWIGMPIMRSDKFALTARTFNQVYSGVCKDHGYWYVDAYRLFSDKGGKYAPYLPNSSGDLQLMRESDGAHLTGAGGDRVARELVKLLQQNHLL
jgi:hypothetical protein